jgi:hypothetical protein
MRTRRPSHQTHRPYRQTHRLPSGRQGLADTLDKTIALQPDRIAFYRLAVIPELFRCQNVFQRTDLPSSEKCLELNLLAINRFLQSGYEFIGLDHFARPDEPMAQARREGTLRRTFQGMTTGKGLDILGLGPSAISQLDDAFAQNYKTMADWSREIADAVEYAASQGLRVAPRTAHRRLANPEFRRRLQAMRADMLQRSAGLLTAAALEAVRQGDKHDRDAGVNGANLIQDLQARLVWQAQIEENDIRGRGRDARRREIGGAPSPGAAPGHHR